MFSVEWNRIMHQRAAMRPSSIPKGLNRPAQGWPKSARAYPGWMNSISSTLKGLNIQRLANRIQPFQGCYGSSFSPRLAPSPAFAALPPSPKRIGVTRRRGKSQTWAECSNPVGIGKPVATFHKSRGIPLKTGRNQKGRFLKESEKSNRPKKPLRCQHRRANPVGACARAVAGKALAEIG